jgi:hypothetical protein
MLPRACACAAALSAKRRQRNMLRSRREPPSAATRRDPPLFVTVLPPIPAAAAIDMRCVSDARHFAARRRAERAAIHADIIFARHAACFVIVAFVFHGADATWLRLALAAGALPSQIYGRRRAPVAAVTRLFGDVFMNVALPQRARSAHEFFSAAARYVLQILPRAICLFRRDMKRVPPSPSQPKVLMRKDACLRACRVRAQRECVRRPARRKDFRLFSAAVRPSPPISAQQAGVLRP